MKTKAAVLCVMVAMALCGSAQADLSVIGNAAYGGSDYNLIWDSGTNLVWLDYTNQNLYWGDQMAWAADLDGKLTYNIDPTLDVTWSDSAWRLPDAGANPGYGFDPATQELGDLYYNKLGLAGGSNLTPAPDPAATIFDNLALDAYWTGTEGDPIFSTNPVWMFAFRDTRSAPYYDTVYGFQDVDATAGTGSFFGIPLAVKHAGIAVRGVAGVSDASVVPAPAAIWLGLLGLGTLGTLLRRRWTV